MWVNKRGISLRLDSFCSAEDSCLFTHVRVVPQFEFGRSSRIDILWSVEDIVAVVEASEPKPGKRGPYKKRIAA
jgi:hypothetical protein